MRALVACFFGIILLSVYAWLPGSIGPGSGPRLKSLAEFDRAHPNATKERRIFYKGVQAHLDGNLDKARKNYLELLKLMPNEPNTVYNLRQLDETTF